MVGSSLYIPLTTWCPVRADFGVTRWLHRYLQGLRRPCRPRDRFPAPERGLRRVSPPTPGRFSHVKGLDPVHGLSLIHRHPDLESELARPAGAPGPPGRTAPAHPVHAPSGFAPVHVRRPALARIRAIGNNRYQQRGREGGREPIKTIQIVGVLMVGKIRSSRSGVAAGQPARVMTLPLLDLFLSKV